MDNNQADNAPTPDEQTLKEASEKVAGLEERYAPGKRESVVLPGTDGTISGTAINDWLDDDGNVKESVTKEPEAEA